MELDEDENFPYFFPEPKNNPEPEIAQNPNPSNFNQAKLFNFIDMDNNYPPHNYPSHHYNQEDLQKIQELNQKNQNYSDLYPNSKFFSGLTAFVTLADKNEKNYLNKIDPKLMHENLDESKLRLESFFEEEVPLAHFEENYQRAQPTQRKTSMFKNKKGGINKIRPSFCESIEHSVLELMENSNLNEYEEFSKGEIMGHLENLLFIEDKQENSSQFMKLIENNFFQLLKRLKLLQEHNKLNLQLFVQTLVSFGIIVISDFIKFLKGCDGSFCFDLLKKSNTNHNANISNGHIKEENKSETKVTIDSEVFSTESFGDKNLEKKNRKIWSVGETERLKTLVEKYYPYSIPPEILESLSKRMNRTIYSLQNKIQKLRKVNIKFDEKKFNEIFSKIEEDSSNSLNLSCKSKSKYEYPLEKMIKATMNSFQDLTATKPNIIKKMEETFFSTSKDNIWKISVAQILASSNIFLKQKGLYSLNENLVNSELLKYLRNEKIEDVCKNESLKNKLIYIFAHNQKKLMNIIDITKNYTNLFCKGMVINDNNFNQIKISMQKTLSNYSEFDKTESKTLYTYIGDNP